MDPREYADRLASSNLPPDGAHADPLIGASAAVSLSTGLIDALLRRAIMDAVESIATSHPLDVDNIRTRFPLVISRLLEDLGATSASDAEQDDQTAQYQGAVGQSAGPSTASTTTESSLPADVAGKRDRRPSK